MSQFNPPLPAPVTASGCACHWILFLTHTPTLNVAASSVSCLVIASAVALPVARMPTEVLSASYLRGANRCGVRGGECDDR